MVLLKEIIFEKVNFEKTIRRRQKTCKIIQHSRSFKTSYHLQPFNLQHIESYGIDIREQLEKVLRGEIGWVILERCKSGDQKDIFYVILCFTIRSYKIKYLLIQLRFCFDIIVSWQVY